MTTEHLTRRPIDRFFDVPLQALKVIPGKEPPKAYIPQALALKEKSPETPSPALSPMDRNYLTINARGVMEGQPKDAQVPGHKRKSGASWDKTYVAQRTVSKEHLQCLMRCHRHRYEFCLLDLHPVNCRHCQDRGDHNEHLESSRTR